MPRARKATRASRRSPARRSSATRHAHARENGHGTNALSLLVEQHHETRRLFRELAEAEGEERRELFLRLADELAAHTTLEERLLYPTIAQIEGMAAVARDALEEHLIVKRLLADMLEKDLEDEVFDAKCRVLEVEVTRHFEEEESGLLPRLAHALGRERLRELGGEMEQEFEELMRHEPRSRVPRETDSAPLIT